MAPLRQQDLRRLLDLVGEAEVAGLRGTAQVAELMLDRLPSLIPCDTVMYADAAEQGPVATNSEFTAFRRREQAQWLDCVAHHPKLKYWDKHPTAGAVRFSDVIGRRVLQSLPIYNYFWKPFDIRYDLGLKIAVSARSVVWLSCARRNRDFSDEDRAVFDALRPYATAIFRRAESWRFINTVASRFGLSRREGDVLALVIAGKTNTEIARELFLSPGTIRKHLEQIYPKLGVRTRTEAASVVLPGKDHALVDGLPRAAAAVFALTPREVQVLGRVSSGETNHEIGAALGVAPETVKKHLAHVYAKLGVRGRTDAAVRAVRLGLVRAG